MADNFPKDTSNFKLLISDYDGTLAGLDHTVSKKILELSKNGFFQDVTFQLQPEGST